MSEATRTTPEALAMQVRTAVEALNKACVAAADAGLNVNYGMTSIHTIGRATMVMEPRIEIARDWQKGVMGKVL